MSKDIDIEAIEYMEAAIRAARYYIMAIEKELLRAIEIAEGRVPTNAEVAVYGHRVMQKGDPLTHYTWKGKLLFSVSPYRPGEELEFHYPENP